MLIFETIYSWFTHGFEIGQYGPFVWEATFKKKYLPKMENKCISYGSWGYKL